MASSPCGCWCRPSRRSRNPDQEEDASRGVSRKARQHIVKIRMPGSPARGTTNTAAQTPNTNSNVDSTPAAAAPAAAAVGCVGPSGAAAAAAAVNAAEPSESEGAGQDADFADAAIAVKIRKNSFLHKFRHPVGGPGGPDDVVLVPAGQMCVICMETFKADEVLQVLLCQHLYHERCIDRWLGNHTSCCVCKADVEEMARAIRKPSRRRYSRSRLETRSERSESSRSDSGYGSDQGRSTWSSISAPPSFADRVPAESRPLGGARQPVSVLHTRPRRPQPCSAAGAGSTSGMVQGVLNARSPAFHPRPAALVTRSPVLNPRSPILNSRSPRMGAMPSSLKLAEEPTRPLEWSLARGGGRGGGRERSGSGSSRSSSSSNIGCVSSSDDDDDENKSESTMFSENYFSSRPPTQSGRGERSSRFIRSPPPDRARACSPASQSAASRSRVAPRLFPPLPPSACARGSSARAPPAMVAPLSTPQRVQHTSRSSSWIESNRSPLPLPSPSPVSSPAVAALKSKPRRERGSASTQWRQRRAVLMPMPAGDEYCGPWGSDERDVGASRSPGLSRADAWSQLWEGEGSAKEEEDEEEDEGEDEEEGGRGVEEKEEGEEGEEGGGEEKGKGEAGGVGREEASQQRWMGSRLPSGKLNGWARSEGDYDDDDDVDDFKRLEYPRSSEAGSDERTCSTQWSEMESQFSWGSMKSYAGEEGSLVGGFTPRRRRTSSALTATSQPCEEAAAKTEETGASFSVSVSPGVRKGGGGEDLWATLGGASPGATRRHARPIVRRTRSASGIGVRSASPTMIWDDDP